MSVILELKSLVLSGLKNEDDRVKKAAIRVFNAIDADLDNVGYDPADTEDDLSADEVINAVKELNEAFVDLAVDIDNKGAENSEATTGDLPDALINEDDGN